MNWRNNFWKTARNRCGPPKVCFPATRESCLTARLPRPSGRTQPSARPLTSRKESPLSGKSANHSGVGQNDPLQVSASSNRPQADCGPLGRRSSRSDESRYPAKTNNDPGWEHKFCVMPNKTGEITLRVRYAETDRMGVVYHSHF